MEALVKTLLTMGIALVAVAAVLYGAGHLGRAIALRWPAWRFIANLALTLLVAFFVFLTAQLINLYV